MSALAWEGFKLTMLNRERLFGDSGLSCAYVTIAVPVGCLFLTLAILTNGVMPMSIGVQRITTVSQYSKGYTASVIALSLLNTRPFRPQSA